MSRLQVHRLPVLQDNYTFVIEDTAEQQAVVIDPAEHEPVEAFLHERGLRPVAIWITHEHADHTDGVPGLLRRYGQMPVYGSAAERGRIPNQTHFLNAGDTVAFGGETAKVMFVPGHAAGHIAYYLPESGHLFSGDVVFGLSCGKVFTGDFAQMHSSVASIAALPDSTLIWCGHEYTLANHKFALHVDPDNRDLQRRVAEEKPPTIPLRLEIEKKTSPFMRCSHPTIQAFTGQTEPAEVFAELRRRKDKF